MVVGMVEIRPQSDPQTLRPYVADARSVAVSTEQRADLVAWVNYLRGCQDRILAARGGTEMPGDSTDTIREMRDHPRSI
jgi:hypothetical protein